MNNSFGNGRDVIILSNHINSGGGEGAEIVYSLRDDDTLATSVLNSIGEAGQKIRRVYQRASSRRSKQRLLLHYERNWQYSAIANRVWFYRHS